MQGSNGVTTWNATKWFRAKFLKKCLCLVESIPDHLDLPKFFAIKNIIINNNWVFSA